MSAKQIFAIPCGPLGTMRKQPHYEIDVVGDVQLKTHDVFF